MFSSFLKDLSILKKFLFINFIFFTIIGLFTFLYLKNVQPNLIKKKTSNHIEIINNTIENLNRLKVYRVRIGPRTVSVEIGIEDAKEDELSTQEIKDNIVESIVSKQFTNKMILIELDTVKESSVFIFQHSVPSFK